MKNVIPFFKKVIQNNKLAHLYILTGDAGSPLEQTSLLISYHIISNLKENPTLKKQVLEKTYPNLFVISKEQTILKDDIALLQDEFAKTSLYDSKRVFIINNFDDITLQAANMLLKFLEEPTNANTIGILLTENLDKVLKTIISRAQVVNIPSPSKDELMKELISLETSQLVKEVLVHLSNNYDCAIKLFDNNYFSQALNIARDIYCDIANKNQLVTKYYKEVNNAQFKELYKFLVEILFLFSLDLIRNKEQKYNFTSLLNYSNMIRDNNSLAKLYEFSKLTSNYFSKINTNINIPLNYLNFLIELERIYL